MATIIYLTAPSGDAPATLTVSESPDEVQSQWQAKGAQGILHLRQLDPDRAVRVNSSAVAYWAEHS